MSLRYASQLQVDLMPDEQRDNNFEVVMPFMDLSGIKASIAESVKSGNISDIVGAAVAGIASTFGVLKYCPVVEQIVFGPQSFKTNFTRLNTDYYGYPEDREAIKNVTITMYLDVGNLASYYIEAWKLLMFNQDYEFYYSPQNYKKTIAVIFYGLGGDIPSAIYYLRGCFPIETSAFQLKYSRDPNRLTLSQTFSVDRVDIDTVKANSAILATLASGNPLGIISDQAAAYSNESAYLDGIESETYGGSGSRGLIGSIVGKFL